MKILLVSINHSPEQTGIGKYQGEMAAWLVAHNHQVHVITAPPYYPEWKVKAGYSRYLYRHEKIDGADVYRAPLYVPSAPSGCKRIIHLLSYGLTSLPLLLWQALSFRPQAIILVAPPLMVAPSVLIAGWLSGAKTYLHVQDFEIGAAFSLGLLKRPWLYKLALGMERAAFRAFSGVSTISRNMRAKLLEKGVEPKSAYLIPNWANIQDFDPSFGPGDWEKTLKNDPQTVLAVYSGNLGRKQGLETIVDAARLLEKDSTIRFIISGDGAGRKDMEERAKGLHNIVFLPVQPMVSFRHLMIAADIHLLPQRAEAADLVMPSKLGNILASGRPVVVGAAQGTQIFDSVQGCGLVVPPEDASSFAQAIQTLAQDPALRTTLGQNGREQALAQWSMDSALTKLEGILNSAAS